MFKIKVLSNLMSGEGLLPGSWMSISHCVLTLWKELESSLGPV